MDSASFSPVDDPITLYPAHIQPNIAAKKKREITKDRDLEKTVLKLALNCIDSTPEACLQSNIRAGEDTVHLKFLLKCCNQLNAIDKQGNSFVHLACKAGNQSFVKTLVEKGGNIHDINYEGKRPLHYAVESGNKELVAYLLSVGADIEVKDSKGFTPLFHAVVHNNGLFSFLVENGANPFFKNEEGLTPFHYAAEDGNYSAVLFYLQHGFNPFEKPKTKKRLWHTHYESPYELVRRRKHYDVERLMIEFAAQNGYERKEDCVLY